MAATITATGLEIDTQEDAFNAALDDLASELALTAAQRELIRRTPRNALHALLRIGALADVACQEALLSVYRALSLEAEGEQLDRVVALAGVQRLGVRTSTATLRVGGTNGTSLPLGSRWSYDTAGSTWVQTSATTEIAGGEAFIEIESEDAGSPDEITLLDTDWSSLSGITGITTTSVWATEQQVVGAPIETDAQLRARFLREIYARSQGPLVAIEAAVSEVDGVSYVKAYDNTEDATDADGIPSRAINVVVDGGAESAVVEAIRRSRPAGIYLHGTDHEVTVDLGLGRVLIVRYDDVEEVPLWIRATIGTSTSETPAPDDVIDQCEALLLARATSLAAIGVDVLPRKLAGSLDDVEGFDDVTIELSDDGATWQTTKWEISIRQRPTFASARVEAVEA